jgi:hemoglobin
MSASIDSLHDNEQLNRQNPKLAALKGKNEPIAFKQKVTDFICQLTGGPCEYRGRTMRESHGPLDISEADWKVFIDDTVRVLTKLGVSGVEQRELLELMATTKADIVKYP